VLTAGKDRQNFKEVFMKKNQADNNIPICQSEVGFFVELVEKNGFVVKSIKPSNFNDYKVIINIPAETKDLLLKLIQKNLSITNDHMDSNRDL
jgi:hypothetical protein